ncbi:MAG: hypothetical protein KF745_04005 [Phycisphaeraceae bacterium]|nr:hypothetical protein [Phycisphaeraceae bacterium]
MTGITQEMPSRNPLFSPASPAAAMSLATRQRDFAAAISRASILHGATPEQQARESAEEFVAIALVQPVLTHLRNTNNAASPFQPTSAEKNFRGFADAQVARQIVRTKQFPLVDRVAQQILDHVTKRSPGALEASA